MQSCLLRQFLYITMMPLINSCCKVHTPGQNARHFRARTLFIAVAFVCEHTQTLCEKAQDENCKRTIAPHPKRGQDTGRRTRPLAEAVTVACYGNMSPPVHRPMARADSSSALSFSLVSRARSLRSTSSCRSKQHRNIRVSAANAPMPCAHSTSSKGTQGPMLLC